MYGPLPQYVRDDSDPAYKKVPPGEIYEYRKLPPTEPIYLPEIARNRRCTDVAFIVLFVICVIGLIVFSVFIFQRPLQRKITTTTEKPTTTHKMGDNSWMFVADKTRDKKEEIKETEKVNFNYKDLIYTLLGMNLTAIVLCYLMFFCFRCNTKRTLVGLLVVQVLFFLITTILSWWMLTWGGDYGALAIAIVNTVFLITVAIVVCLIRSRMALIVAIYEEAFDAMFAIPTLLFLPLLTTLALICANAPSCVISVLFLDKYENPLEDEFLYLYCLVLSFVTLWFITFLLGSQCIVVAGTVAAFYFARDKSNLRSPFCTSFCVYVRFHLGTVSAGSLIITILTMLKKAADKAARGEEDKGLAALIVACCFDFIIEVIDYLTKKAYIMTAIHGKSLCTSGKRAARLLWSNLLDTIAVDFIGGLAIGGAALVMMVATWIVGFAINYSNIMKMFKDRKNLDPLVIFLIGLYCSGLVIAIFLQMLTVTIETVFLCFCEDKMLNDGSRERPYYMSLRLMRTVLRIFGRIDPRRASLTR